MAVAISQFPLARDITNLARSLLGDASPNLGPALPVASWSVTTIAGVPTLTINFATNTGFIVGDVFQFHGLAFIINFSQDTQVTAPANSFTGSGGVDSVFPIGLGQWATDPILLPMLNAGINELGRGLKMTGSTEFKEDNVYVTIPGITFAEPSTQVILSFQGLSISSDANPAPVFDVATPLGQLPQDLKQPIALWERPTGLSTTRFIPMIDMTQNGGLPSQWQGFLLGMWEWIDDGISFLGATQDVDIRIRYERFFPPVSNGASQVLILESKETLALITAAMASSSRGGINADKLKADAEAAKEKLINAITRKQQPIAHRGKPYRGGYGGFGNYGGDTGSGLY